MNVSADVLRTHIAYTNWATNRLLAQAAQFAPEELTRDFGTADKSVVQTLAHVYLADGLWLARLEGRPAVPKARAADVTLDTLQSEWPPLQEQWTAYAAGITDDSANGVIHYSALNGQPFAQPLWQLILHIVNHGTHHRGQASGFVRALGKAPQPLDLVAYYRQLGASQS